MLASVIMTDYVLLEAMLSEQESLHLFKYTEQLNLSTLVQLQGQVLTQLTQQLKVTLSIVSLSFLMT
jgi:hypothetical protein